MKTHYNILQWKIFSPLILSMNGIVTNGFSNDKTKLSPENTNSGGNFLPLIPNFLPLKSPF